MGGSTMVRVKLLKECISRCDIPNHYALQSFVVILDKDSPNLRITMAAALLILLFVLYSRIHIPPVDPTMVVATVRQKAIGRLKRHFPHPPTSRS